MNASVLGVKSRSRYVCEIWQMDDSIKRKWGVYPEMAVPIRKLMSMSDKPLELGSPIFTPIYMWDHVGMSENGVYPQL